MKTVLSNIKTTCLKELTDWQLVCLFNLGGKQFVDVPQTLVAKIQKSTWAIQDGYGEPGFTPCQGWDWSGIRDSSQAAKEKMADVINILLRNAGYTPNRAMGYQDVSYEFDDVSVSTIEGSK